MTNSGMPNLTQSRRAAHWSPIPHHGEEQLARLRICLAESDKADLRPGSSRQIQSLVVDVSDTLLIPRAVPYSRRATSLKRPLRERIIEESRRLLYTCSPEKSINLARDRPGFGTMDGMSTHCTS